MINYLRHNQIDKIRWDDCISRSLNRRVYAFSWYLDIVSPGWDALVEDDYASIFPLTCKSKWFIPYVAQPFFTQQLGLFSPKTQSEARVCEFVRAIPHKFRFAEIHLNSKNSYPESEGETTLRLNYELDLTPVYEELAAKYVQNTRRNLKKAVEGGVTLNRNTGVDELISLFHDNFGKKEGKLRKENYSTLRQLIQHGLENNMGYILGSDNKQGVLSAGAFFLFDHLRVYFLFAASNPEARENGAMFFLIDRFIAERSGSNHVLDFEGGNDPNLGRFYKGFGALEAPYPALRINRLSKVAARGLYFMRKFRK